VIKAESVELPSGLRSEVHRGGEGQPLVYLHSAGGIQPGDPVISALAERFAVVAPVAPGFNDLDELDDIRDVHDLALHYDDLFDALGLDAVSVVGHSFGGMVAAELAAHVPHRVAKLVMIAPVGLWNDSYPVADLFATPLTELNDLMWGDADSPAAQMMSAALGALGDSANLDAMVDLLLVVVKGLTAAGKFMWPIPDKGLGRRLRRIKAPTLVVWGSADKLASPRYAEDFVAGIPNARSVLIEGAGHMAPLERTAEVLTLVGEFLA
jgi:pimeloyl-ACP methyl ester carboxylesterase